MVMLNAVVMALQWYGQPESLNRATNIANYAFTGYFVVEMVRGATRVAGNSLGSQPALILDAGLWGTSRDGVRSKPWGRCLGARSRAPCVARPPTRRACRPVVAWALRSLSRSAWGPSTLPAA
jgi:hypothetical protein